MLDERAAVAAVAVLVDWQAAASTAAERTAESTALELMVEATAGAQVVRAVDMGTAAKCSTRPPA